MTTVMAKRKKAKKTNARRKKATARRTVRKTAKKKVATKRKAKKATAQRKKKAGKKATRGARSKAARNTRSKAAKAKAARKSQRRGGGARKGKLVYYFGDGKADGHAGQRNLLGGKGANLAEMSRLGLPVPPGITITTEVCTYYVDHDGNYPRELKKQVEAGIKKLERSMKKRFGDPKNPLLVSVRSGARVSMPGMMDTVLNLGPQRHDGQRARRSGRRRALRVGQRIGASSRCTATSCWA